MQHGFAPCEAMTSAAQIPLALKCPGAEQDADWEGEHHAVTIHHDDPEENHLPRPLPTVPCTSVASASAA